MTLVLNKPYELILQKKLLLLNTKNKITEESNNENKIEELNISQILLNKFIERIKKHNFTEIYHHEMFIFSYFEILLRYVDVDFIEDNNIGTGYISQMPQSNKNYYDALLKLNELSFTARNCTQIPDIKNHLFKENHFEKKFSLKFITSNDSIEQNNKLFLSTIEKYYVIKNDNFTIDDYADITYEFSKLWHAYMNLPRG